MPPPEKPEKDKAKEKERSGREGAKAKARAAGRGPSGQDGKSKSSSKQTAAEIRAEEYAEFIGKCPETHTGWLSQPLSNISTSLSIPLVYFSMLLLLLLTLLLLLSPATWIPHIASPIVLLIPLQNTLQCIAQDKRREHKGGGGTDIIQWIIFWVGWVALGWAGEIIRIFRPGWRGVWEIGRVGAAIVLGGPWFGKDAMIVGKPSLKLAEAEKREAAEEARSGREAAKKRQAEKDPKKKTDDKSRPEKTGDKGKGKEEKKREKSTAAVKDETKEKKD